MTSIFTDKGAALVAEAIKSGTSIQISQFAVGSGANEPVSTQTALQKEEYRAYINEMTRADDVLTLKLVIPAEAGASTEGFTINELGIFTAAGDLFTIAKVPTYQKTLISTITYSVKIDISKEAAVECKVDDTQVYVTHSLLMAKLLDYYTKTAADARFIIADPASVGSATQPVFLSNKKITASTATAGGAAQPIFLENGILKAISGSVGSGVKPIYLNAGTLTASNSTLGDATHGIYLSDGEFKVTDGTTLDDAGSGVNPIYTTGGKITASASSVGFNGCPIYLKDGTLTALTVSVGSQLQPIFLNKGIIDTITTTMGSATKLMYLNQGKFAESFANVGSATQPIYLNKGELTASTSSVGDADTPIYLNAGVITAGNKPTPFSKVYYAANFSTFSALMTQIIADGVTLAYVNCDNFTDWATGSTYTYNNVNNALREIYFYISSGDDVYSLSTTAPTSTLYVGGSYSWGKGAAFSAVVGINLKITVSKFNLLLNIVSTGCCTLELRKCGRFTGIFQAKDGNSTGGDHSSSHLGMNKIRYFAAYTWMCAQMSGTFSFERIGEMREIAATTGNGTLAIKPYDFSAGAEVATTLYVGNNASFADIRNNSSVVFTIQPVKGAQIFVPTATGFTAGQAVNTWTSYGVIWQY